MKKIVSQLTIHEYLVLAAISDGEFRPTKDEADNIEVIAPKMLRKITINLINRGLVNVTNGVYYLSVTGKKILRYEDRVKPSIKARKRRK